jgi:putative ABC transport system permease protein
MNIFKLSLANLRFRPLSSFFNVLILALGMAIIITLLHVGQQVAQRFDRDLQGIDLVVGAKGSPIQLILSSVFQLDSPTGNIPLDEAERLQANPLIRSAIPLALGDNYLGFRIVGTTPDYPRHYGAQLAEGDYWAEEMQAVFGSEVARRSGLHLGQTFAGSHGLVTGGEEHGDLRYRVVGLLKPTGTVLDRLVLTDVGSVWHIHEHHHDHGDDDEAEEDHHHHEEGLGPEHDEEDEHHAEGDHGSEEPPEDRELTALLLSYRTPVAAVTLPHLVNKTSSMQAASPAFEMARLFKILDVGSDAIQLFGTVLMAIAALGFFVTLFNAVHDRHYDIALMRSMGATRRKVFAFVLAEGLTLGVLGTALGILLGHGLAYGAQRWIETTRHLTLNPVGFHPYELVAVAAAIGISALAAVIPAMMAYRINPAKVLSRGL